jgi:hypothetical protein
MSGPIPSALPVANAVHFGAQPDGTDAQPPSPTEMGESAANADPADASTIDAGAQRRNQAEQPTCTR